jgi:hypothetical protein
MEVLINIRIPEPKNLESLRAQKTVSNPIRPNTFRQSVLTTICLDDQLGPKGNKIDNVRTNRRLSTKVITEALQFSKPDPQFGLLRRETFAKRASKFVRHGCPPTNLGAPTSCVDAPFK